MLSDIQSMIMDYKKKSQYSNLIGSPEEQTANPSTIKAQLEAQEMQVPHSRLTYRTGDSFDVSITSRSHSRSLSKSRLSRTKSFSRSRSRSQTRNYNISNGAKSRESSGLRGNTTVLQRSPFAPQDSKDNRQSIDSGAGDPYDVVI